MLAIRDAVATGVGVAPLQALLADPDIAASRLIRVLPDWKTPCKPLLVTDPSAQSVIHRPRLFIDHLATALPSA